MKKQKIMLFSAILLTSYLYSCTGNAQSSGSETDQQTEQVAKPMVKNIAQEEFLKLQNQEGVMILDVRTTGEVAQGYIQGASIFADVTGNSFQNDIAALDKNKTYLVYCKSGARSSRAAQMMIDAGFTNVYNLKGGISNWTGPIAK